MLYGGYTLTFKGLTYFADGDTGMIFAVVLSRSTKEQISQILVTAKLASLERLVHTRQCVTTADASTNDMTSVQ